MREARNDEIPHYASRMHSASPRLAHAASTPRLTHAASTPRLAPVTNTPGYAAHRVAAMRHNPLYNLENPCENRKVNVLEKALAKAQSTQRKILIIRVRRYLSAKNTKDNAVKIRENHRSRCAFRRQ